MVQKNLIRLCMVNGKKTKSSAMVTRILKELSRSSHVPGATKWLEIKSASGVDTQETTKDASGFDPFPKQDKRTLSHFAPFGASRQAPTDPYTYLNEAIDNVKPMLEIRRGKRPFPIPTYRQQQKAIRLLFPLEQVAKRRRGKKNLLNELRNAHAKTGVARQKRDELHKQAEANR